MNEKRFKHEQQCLSTDYNSSNLGGVFTVEILVEKVPRRFASQFVVDYSFGSLPTSTCCISFLWDPESCFKTPTEVFYGALRVRHNRVNARYARRRQNLVK